MTRTADRVAFDLPVRISLIEADIDTLEAGHRELIESLNSIRRVLMGMLVSVTTASILLAVNAFLLRTT